jgi:hypothetical protein
VRITGLTEVVDLRQQPDGGLVGVIAKFEYVMTPWTALTTGNRCGSWDYLVTENYISASILKDWKV